MRKIILAAASAALLVPAVPVIADPPPWAPAHGARAKHWYPEDHYRAGDYKVFRLSRDDRIWHGRDGRYYCKRSDGTTGLVIGAVAGGLLGNAIAPGGSKTLGTILGAGGGALLGRAIDRGDLRCR